MKRLLFILMLLGCEDVRGQNSDLLSPLKSKTILSGSYGEPRTRHFHAGIDFKPHYGYLKDSIFAIEEGYISRINISPEGYGNALYIDHPNGLTSVYAHLHSFTPHVQSFMRSIMTENREYRTEYYPKPDQFKISKGEFIGIMGNSGRSSGPHLHFEIRDTESEVPLNPFTFDIKPEDVIPPVIRGIVMYWLAPDGQIIRKEYHKASNKGNGTYELNTPLVKVGSLSVGIGIHAYDTMNGASNHNGIYSLKSTVNGEKNFSFVLDSIGFHESRYIHTHMDFEEKLANRYISKCFKNPYNPLSIYEHDDQLGVVSIFEYYPRDVNIEVADFEGNTSSIQLRVVRDKTLLPIEPQEDGTSIRIHPVDSLDIQLGSHLLEVLPLTILEPTVFQVQPCDSLEICLAQDEEIATFKPFKLYSSFTPDPQFKDKVVYTSVNRQDRVSAQKVEWVTNSLMVSTLGELKDIRIDYDTIPPMIRVVSIPGSKSTRFKAVIKDNFIPSGPDNQVTFNIYLDDEWLWCYHDLKRDEVWTDIEIPRDNSQHEIKIEATDGVGNVITTSVPFIY